jgi:hypothetical protein
MMYIGSRRNNQSDPGQEGEIEKGRIIEGKAWSVRDWREIV